MLQQDKARQFWEDVLLPVTRICIAISRMGVGSHSNQDFQEKSSKLSQCAHSNLLAPVVLASGDVSKSMPKSYRKRTSCCDWEIEKQALMTAKKPTRNKERRKKNLICTKAALNSNKVAADLKENKELEKRLHVPISTSAEKEKFYFSSSNPQITRRIDVQSADSCETSTMTETPSSPKDADCCVSVQSEARMSVRQSSVSKQGVVESSKDSDEKSKFPNSESKKFSSFSHDRALAPRQAKGPDSALYSGRNTHELGSSKKMHQNRTVCLTLPTVEEKRLRNTASEKTKVKELRALPAIKSGLSMMEILQGINDYDCCNDSSGAENLNEGERNAKRRAKVINDCAPQNRNIHDHDAILNAMLSGKSGIRSGRLNKKTKNGKRREQTEDAKDLRIECNVDATRNERIKSIIKSGNSHHKNRLNKNEIRRVSFSKKTIRTFVPDKNK